MIKEEIDEYLEKNEELKNKLREISLKYSINDFVLFTEKIREYFKYNRELDCKNIYGCIYNVREKYLRIGADTVEERLGEEYRNLLLELLENDRDDKVFYIVTYHYLTLCEDVAYKLTISDNAPFPFLGQTISDLGKKRIEEYNEIVYGDFYHLINNINVDDLEYYNKIFHEFRYHYHSTKHFSLINRLIDANYKINRYDIEYSFEVLLDVFIFRYRVIFTEETISVCMYPERKERIIKGLIEF